MTRLALSPFFLGLALTLGCNETPSEDEHAEVNSDNLPINAVSPPPDPPGTQPPPARQDLLPPETPPTSAKAAEVYSRNGVSLPMAHIRNEWFKELNKVNPQLHDTLLEGLFLSRQSGKEAYVLKRRLGTKEKPGPVLYTISLERGGAENLLSVRFSDRSFQFDHFNAAEDGPTLEQVRERLYTEERIRLLKRELGIFGQP